MTPFRVGSLAILGWQQFWPQETPIDEKNQKPKTHFLCFLDILGAWKSWKNAVASPWALAKDSSRGLLSAWFLGGGVIRRWFSIPKKFRKMRPKWWDLVFGLPGYLTGQWNRKKNFSWFFGDFCVFSDFRPYSNKAVIQVPPYFMEVGPFCMGIGFGPVGPQLMGKSKNQKIIFWVFGWFWGPEILEKMP